MTRILVDTCAGPPGVAMCLVRRVPCDRAGGLSLLLSSMSFEAQHVIRGALQHRRF